MATLKERIAEKKAARLAGGNSGGSLKERIAAKKAARQQAAPQEPQEAERNWYDPVRAVTSGMTLGFGDEIGSAVAAAAAKIAGSEEEYGEIYTGMMESLQDERKAYEKAHPGEALALNVAGGLATGGASLSQLKNLGKTGKFIASVAEGTAGGYGSADMDKRGQGAGTGAAISAGLGAIPVVGRGLANTVSKRRVAQELGKGEDFIPLNLAADGGLSSFYKNTVGRAFGGEKVLDQSKRVLNKALNKQGTLQREVDNLKGYAKREAADTIDNIKQRADDTVGVASVQADDAIDTTKRSLVKTVDGNNQTFRDTASMDSMPRGLDDETRVVIMGGDQQSRNRLINDQWNNNSFGMIKDRQFAIDQDEILARVAAAVDDPALSDVLPELRKIIQNKVGDKMAKVTNKASGYSTGLPTPIRGTMSGAEAMEARNALKRLANSREGLGSNALNRAAGIIDDTLTKQLDPQTAKQFTDELQAYGTFQTMKAATDKAGIKNQGNFTPDDWMSKSNFGNYRQAGTARLQQEAQGVQLSNTDAVVEAGASEAATKSALTKTKAAATNLKNTQLKNAKKAAAVDPLSGRLQMHLDAADRGVKSIQENMPNEKANTFMKIFSTGLLGAPFTAGVGGAGGLLGPNLPVGYGVAKGLSTEGAQRTLAGQTDAQKKLAEQLMRYDASSMKPLLEQFGRGATRGTIVGQE
tara:strand:+ start:8120 stop:10210 length:2091 start_codon:yes stop_codon:yes gene_type:complete